MSRVIPISKIHIYQDNLFFFSSDGKNKGNLCLSGRSYYLYNPLDRYNTYFWFCPFYFCPYHILYLLVSVFYEIIWMCLTSLIILVFYFCLPFLLILSLVLSDESLIFVSTTLFVLSFHLPHLCHFPESD